MKKVPIKTRVLIVASAIWLIYWLIDGLTNQYSEYADYSFYMAFIPLVIFWGIFWIIEDIKRKRKEKSNQKGNA